ncbi:LytR/AlgR family response regulator transcription factor [Arcticibacterium luteifluviistationis]|uniref:HTH LytTR-type domain-containing protein n=1 Tax=Arcticibacterium luteifluviistationis TaxID=1784714 RepID=A0A2Z4G710_9BACT|nr:LytTR family DNA-binding domain-containing protein [Arcticibacterium luteifluviistationis]AWV96956.1 hypothetical protein DJ013_01700 [Arcticibacterium luteifluviistationis]
MKTLNKEQLIHVGARKLIPPNDILMLKADVNYTEVFLMDGSKILSSTTIGTIEKRLDGFDFFRVNRSTVVNLKFLDKCSIFSQKSLISVSVNQGQKKLKIAVSRRRQANLSEFLQNKLFVL